MTLVPRGPQVWQNWKLSIKIPEGKRRKLLSVQYTESHKPEPFLPQGNQPEAFNFPLELILSFLLILGGQFAISFLRLSESQGM